MSGGFEVTTLPAPVQGILTKAGRAVVKKFAKADFDSMKFEEDMLTQAMEFQAKAKHAVTTTENEIVALEKEKKNTENQLAEHETEKKTLEDQLPNLWLQYQGLESEYNLLEDTPELTEEQKKGDQDMRAEFRETRRTNLATLAQQKKDAQEQYTTENNRKSGAGSLVTSTKQRLVAITGGLVEKRNLLEGQKKNLQTRTDDVLKRQITKFLAVRQQKISAINSQLVIDVHKAVTTAVNENMQVGADGQSIARVLGVTPETIAKPNA
tara:strand:+ start:67 stop:867 length:801 start_codon:yes stop_codon:yes gene_type:complete